MPDITMYVRPGVEAKVIEGDPPVDQTAAVASLTAELAAAIAERDALKARIAKAAADLNG